MRFPTQAIPGAAKALWIALAFGAPSGTGLAGQSASSFRVTVQVPWGQPAGGGGSAGGGASTGGGSTGGVVCRSTATIAAVECVSGGTGSVIPIVAGGGGTAPSPDPSTPVVTSPQPAPQTATAQAGQPLAPQPATLPADVQRILAGAGWRNPSEVWARTWIVASEPGLSGVFGAVSASRRVSWGGQDYLEMTVSW